MKLLRLLHFLSDLKSTNFLHLYYSHVWNISGQDNKAKELNLAKLVTKLFDAF